MHNQSLYAFDAHDAAAKKPHLNLLPKNAPEPNPGL